MPLTEFAASNARLTPLGKSYDDHYSQQRGGTFPVFRGGIGYQGGNGLSEILKSAGQFLLPIAASAAQKFVESTSDSLNKGKSLSKSTKEALKPTLVDAAENITDKFFQNGSGKIRRRRRKGLSKRFRRKNIKKRHSLKRRKHFHKKRRVYKGKLSHNKRKNFIDSINF